VYFSAKIMILNFFLLLFVFSCGSVLVTLLCLSALLFFSRYFYRLREFYYFFLRVSLPIVIIGKKSVRVRNFRSKYERVCSFRFEKSCIILNDIKIPIVFISGKNCRILMKKLAVLHPTIS